MSFFCFCKTWKNKRHVRIFFGKNSGKRSYNIVNITVVTYCKTKHDTDICYFEIGKNKNLMIFITACSFNKDYQCFTPLLWRKQLQSFARSPKLFLQIIYICWMGQYVPFNVIEDWNSCLISTDIFYKIELLRIKKTLSCSLYSYAWLCMHLIKIISLMKKGYFMDEERYSYY